MNQEPHRSSRLTFFATPPHVCSYLPDRQATTVFADPRVPLSTGIYSVLARNGFRRSGSHVYRPQCVGCRACVPVRVLIAQFEPRRSDRRCLQRNADLVTVDRPAEYDAEHFELYRRYVTDRHAGGGMDDPEPQTYRDFLTATWPTTRFLEFRLGAQLVAVAVVDELDDALSAVYTFFDPDLPERGLGRYAILQEIARAAALRMRWLYLGYWIAQSPKMAYKSQYQPLEYFIEGQWRRTPD